jgi:hypothetical protein
MSTSNRPREVPETAAKVDSLKPFGEGGLPDAASIAKLANEFFRALPGEEPALAATLPDASGIDLPSEEALRSLPETLMAGAEPIQAAVASMPLWPEIPGGVAASDFSSVPSFSFLQEARSLFPAAELSAPQIPGVPFH